jgi:alkanesulfonate monooxygenase SsuD/methylene tetrahydromethanopterin reductase-like flavin-dependent oxidoreductase (luciferase family)
LDTPENAGIPLEGLHMPQRNQGILDGNPFKMGLFGSNCSGGLSFTSLPERWDASWENNLKLALMADEAGFECMVPIARWKGFGGSTDVNGTSFETITWACGLLAQTRKISVFGTVHVPMIHPVLAAKQMVTADHVGHGRFGLNIVCGFNRIEFQMFGVPQYEHDLRYEQGQEWWEVVKKVWSCAGPSTHEGRFYKLSALEGLPGPYGGKNPVMMNAGVSTAGRNFAIRNSDLHFDDLHFGNCEYPEDASDRIKETKRLAREYGRDIQVWIPVSVVCRPSKKEVDEYLSRCVENADWEALEHLMRLLAGPSNARTFSIEAMRQKIEGNRKVLGYGENYSIYGDPDRVAQELNRFHKAGFDGVENDLINYLYELPYFVQEVLPRLERMEIRRPVSASLAAT